MRMRESVCEGERERERLLLKIVHKLRLKHLEKKENNKKEKIHDKM